MNEIVNKYIELNKLFQKCAKNQFTGDFSFDDMKSYYLALDNFLETARAYYSNNDLDLSTAISLFSSDEELQKELKECVEAESKTHTI